ncbi:Long-chain-fatty-acid--CoA ligase [Thalassovita gelatinovora]|uniref:Long-chain-fatty-acid--CoA ligase n=1 Tax=Thalassovita gelatinovora TaxID=53501 RepID=A0A0P1FST7_THAGE|nr:class I adenylate-forming enzyme family protein [Thalassovita gelatinovora]QIZ79578.1 acyl--CoA ligase [Thalassovita gelatinovora]CUH63065.1 Long-chain-fatty-acid--CoA ligase [Thalassovita gelatinovora]SEQ15142.1 Acyl-CoA synthetase (AMP-forming)/AMP-acid ligase II [Thalassovita gelatinovora]
MHWLDDLISGKPADTRAIIDHDGTAITFGALNAAIDAAADAMRTHGVQPGDRVLVVAENCALLAAAFLAAMRLRAWCVPLNARVTAPELDAIRADAGPRLTLFTDVASTAADTHATRLGAVTGPKVLGHPLRLQADPAAQAETVQDSPETQVAALVYTSGSTGAPKGVMLSHASLMFNAQVMAQARNFAPDDVILLALPCTHIMALSTALLAGLSAGATVRLMARFSVDGMLDALAEGGSVVTGVPAMFDQILRRTETGEAALVAPRLRMVGSGGAPLDPALKARIEAQFGLPLNNGYGLTEAGPGVASTVFGPRRTDGSIGYVYPDCEARIDDAGTDGVGELQFRGPGVMLGYYHNPQASAEAMTADGFLRTGDLARIDPDGALHLVGRSKELIIRSGFNVYPPEVEAALMACPGVLQAAVAGRAIAGNEEVLAFVTTDGSTDAAAIAAHLRNRLAAYKQPQHIIVVPSMPLTSAGKLHKPALVAQFAPPG